MDRLIKRLSSKQKVQSSDPQNLCEKLWRYQGLQPQHFLFGGLGVNSGGIPSTSLAGQPNLMSSRFSEGVCLKK